MEPHELQEHTEHAHHSGQKGIGLTMAIVAVLLAMVTLLSHRSETEEVLTLTQNVDDWQFYSSKHDRAYQFALAAEIEALLPNGKESALKNYKNSVEEECGIPAPKGCDSPQLKKSSILQQLAAESKGTGAKPEKAEADAHEAHAATAAAGEPSAEKQEKSAKEKTVKDGASQAFEKANERKKETELYSRKTDYYDAGELFLEMSIVLCSISLLAETKAYWKLSFISTVIGVAVAIWGLLQR